MSQLPPRPSFARPAPSPARPKRRAWRGGAIFGAALAAVVVAAVVVVAGVISADLADAPQMPSREALWSIRRSPGLTFLDRAGQVLATRGAKYGQAVTLQGLPPYVAKAFLAAEDRRFYQHGPVDLYAIGRATFADLRHARSVEGASTLTQQLARTLFLKREQNLKRKIQEAYLAWRLEQSMSKDEVLELYMNRTYFGDGAYGLDAAARSYFGKPAGALTLMEAATLAGLPNAPSRLALTNDLPAAVARGRRVLQVMLEEGWIAPATFQAAMAETPALTPAQSGEGANGYVLDQAAAQALQLTGGATPDLVIRTTIDSGLQATAIAAVRDVVMKEGARRSVSQGALVSLAPDGAILAMVGGLDHDKSSFNRVVQARRQPGSAFKPFVYGAAVEQGATPQTVRLDAPVSLGRWNPENYHHSYLGPVSLQEALARSLNTVSVRLALEVGPTTVAALARRFGLADIPIDPGPSIALGAYEVSPLELASGYQVFQTGGGRVTPYLISEVRSTRGDILFSQPPSAPPRVYDPLFATRMVAMMKAVITTGTGTGADIGRPAAGKTGTSQDYRDAWFVGFTPDFLTAVWVGNDDGAPMAGVTGGQLPAEIWKRFMTVAEKPLPPRDFPWLAPDEAPPQVETASEVTGPYLDEPPALSRDPAGGVSIDRSSPAGSARQSMDDPADEDDAGAANDRAPRIYEPGEPPPIHRLRPRVETDDPPEAEEPPPRRRPPSPDYPADADRAGGY